jgi:glycosyltransferase involved in cell wall biosynthesis
VTLTDRNAAIWFASDGFDPEGKGVNGRRMAGESFLRGWFAHAGVPEFVSLSHGPSEAQRFAEMARAAGVTAPLRAVRLDAPQGIAPLGTVYYSGPNFAPETWRRSFHGAAAWSICGITHTMSSVAAMQGVFDLRVAASQEWDAVICTSRAVQTAMRTQLDLVDAHLAQRFGGPLPPRFQTPVLPLGIDCAEFRRDPALRAGLRARLGIAEGDVAALVVARLTPHEKFDPLPVFTALAEAQRALPAGQRLHFILYGTYPDPYSRRVFERGAAALMPDVGFHPLPHEGAAARLAALSAADLFLFPIDNLQESFGIAPVEAMAAGLPVIASDWDGLRDTVDGGVGFRIPTLAGRPEHAALTGQRHFGGTDSYVQYLSQNSAITRIDIRALISALRILTQEPERRARMGAAGQARARTLFDWSVVIPRMQELFTELSAIRRSAANPAPAVPATRLPVAPAPMTLFSAFPSARLAVDDRRWRLLPIQGRPGIAEALDLRDYAGTRRVFEAPEDILRLAQALSVAGSVGALASELSRATGFHIIRVERILLWLAKYHFIAEAE